MKSFMKAYTRDLNVNIKKKEEKRKLIRLSERFIMFGIILIIITFITAIIF